MNLKIRIIESRIRAIENELRQTRDPIIRDFWLDQRAETIVELQETQRQDEYQPWS